MDVQLRKKLVFHAAAVILIGMLSGFPLIFVLLGYLDGQVSDWKLSHMEGLLNGLLMLGVAASGGLLVLSKTVEKVLFWCLVFTGYGNALYGWARGLSGQAGMDFSPPISNQIAALLGGLPIFTALVLIIIVMIAARKS